MEKIKAFLEYPIVEYKDLHLTPMDVGMVVFIYILTTALLRLFNLAMSRNVKKKTWMERSTVYAIQKLTAYFAYTIATAVALETIGLDLTILMAGSAALLVGIGLGVQQIFNDFTCGLIILFGGTVKVGDIVEFNDTVGRIIAIDFRTSHIKTRDNITIIVPNSQLVSENVINWTTMDDLTRFRVEVSVAYGSDTEKVTEIQKSIAGKHPSVSSEKPVTVRLRNFGESGLGFAVFFWARDAWGIEVVKSDVRLGIEAEFKRNGITIPFPQRDVHYYPKP